MDKRRFAIERARLQRATDSIEAELSLWKIYRMWDRLGPTPIIDVLTWAADPTNSGINVREQARHLLNQARIRTGDLTGAQAGYEALGMIRQWLVIGPFDNEGGTGFEVAFFPELSQGRAIDPLVPRQGKSGTIKLREAPPAIAPFGYVHLEALFEPEVNICAYAVTTLKTRRKGTAQLRIGAGGAFKAYWNGQQALSDPAERRPNPDRFAAIVKVRRGTNRLVIKVCTEQGTDLGFYARITDHRGRPWSWTDTDQAIRLTGAARDSVKPRPLAQPLTQLIKRAEKRPTDARAQYQAARYLYDTGGRSRFGHQARDFAAAACRLGRGVDPCLLWGDLALDPNERRQAIGLALTREPDSVDAMLALARLEMHGTEPARALPLLDRAVVEQPRDFHARALTIELLAHRGFLLTAFERSRRLLDRHPDVPYLLALSAELAEQSGRAADSLILARRRLEVDFADDTVQQQLLRAAAAGEDEEAFDSRLQALEALRPYDGQTLTFTAGLLEGRGRIEAAEQRLTRCVELAPADPETLKNLGHFAMRNGAVPKGLSLLQAAARISPQDTQLTSYLDQRIQREPLEAQFAVPADRFLTRRSSTTTETNVQYLVDLTAVQVFESGLASRFVQLAVQINNRQGIQDWRRHWIHFSPNSQRVKVLAARVHRTDGSVVNATGRYTMPVSEPWYRLYYDVEAEVIELPTVDPGDVVEFRYQVDDIAHRNMFNDYFGELVFVHDTSPKALWRYVLLAPKSRRFYFNPPVIAELEHTRTNQDNHTLEIFEVRDVPGIEQERGMPGMSSQRAYLHVSTYRSWAELGRWYQGLVRHQLGADNRIRQKVRELTATLKTARQKTAAIYNWIISSTRYVGLEFGIHGYKPYRAPLVFSRGFGDCKDKASLMVTMLGEAGVTAEFALVRTRRLGPIEGKLASLAVFDHAIVHVPELDLWLDGTAEHHGTAEFPFQDQDTLALRLTRDGPRLVTTPVHPPSANIDEETVDIRLEPNGDATLEAAVTAAGSRAATLRREFQVSGAQRERFEAALALQHPGARLEELAFIALSQTEQPVRYRYTAVAPAFGRAGEQTVDVPLDTGVHLLKQFGRLPTRIHALVIGPKRRSARTVTIRLPQGYAPALLPEPTRLASDFGTLDLRLIHRAASLRIERRLEFTVHEIGPERYAAFLEFCRQVDDALSRRIVLRKN